MTSMDIKILPPEHSSHKEPVALDSNKKSNTIPDQHDPKTIVDEGSNN
jgi:hypothetical protein